MRNLVVLSLIALAGNAPAAVQQTQQCSGHVCVAEAVIWPQESQYWTVSAATTDGRGRNAVYPCADCKFCEAEVDWVYTGSTTYRVDWVPTGSAAGQGGGLSFGTFSLFTGCDEEPSSGSFTGGGEYVTVDLFCPCN